MIQPKATIAAVIRSNTLDLAVCQVRDWFGDESYLCGHLADHEKNI